MTKATNATARILVIGGGYVGMYTALRLQRSLKHQLRQAERARARSGSGSRPKPGAADGPAQAHLPAPRLGAPAAAPGTDPATAPSTYPLAASNTEPNTEPNAAPATATTSPQAPGSPLAAGPEPGGTHGARAGSGTDFAGVEITVVDPEPYMTYQPFLPEAAAGSISPRHVVVPLRRVLPHCRIVTGEAVSIDHDKRVARIQTLATGDEGAGPLELPYTELVLAPGSVSRTLPVPGLAEHGIGFRTVEEAIGLRNHVLEQLDIASSTRDLDVREAALTFVFVGGGYAGVEALAELEDMARYACRYYHNVRPEELRFLLVEAAERILPEVGEEMGRYALRELRARNIDVRLGTRLVSCTDRVAVLSDGSHHPARTLVWTAGVKPHPVLAATGLPLDERGRLRCTPRLRVAGVEHVWAAGDAAAVPDLAAEEDGRKKGGKDGGKQGGKGGGEGALCAPNAQHAVRQARRLADNLAASLRGEPEADYRHAHAGSVASLGLHKGVAQVYGHKLKGRSAWLAHRVYHLSRVPTVNRKARVLAEWVLAGLFKREIVSLGSLEHPRAEFELAADPTRRPAPPS